jgi:hypothetical protein
MENCKDLDESEKDHLHEIVEKLKSSKNGAEINHIWENLQNEQKSLLALNHIAENTHTSPELLAQILSEYPWLAKIIAKNPNTPLDNLITLFKEYPEEVINNAIVNMALFENYTFLNELLETIIIENENIITKYFYFLNQKGFDPLKIMDITSKMKLACSNNIPQNIIELLADDPSSNVRYHLAKNAKTSSKNLEKLAKSEECDIRYLIVSHRNTSTLLLDYLAKDVLAEIRYRVAKDYRTSPQTLEMLSEDEYSLVRQSVANSVQTTLQVLDKLASDNDEKVRLKVINNPKTTLDILRKLATDTSREVKLALIKDPKATLEILSMMQSDQDTIIRTQVERKISQYNSTHYN